MCGYCTEGLLISLIDELGDEALIGQDVPLVAEPMQEVKYLPQTISAIDVKRDSLVVVLCRVLEHYLLREFEPELFYAASRKFGEAEIAAYLESQSSFNDDYWRPLFDMRFYTKESFWKAFVGDEERLAREALSALSGYHRWWIQGIRRERSDPVERIQETGLMDPVANTPTEEWSKFYGQFPALFFSLTLLRKIAPDAKIIRLLARNQPVEIPDFTALDLWLQRRAFTLCLNRDGTRFLKDLIDDTEESASDEHDDRIRNEVIHNALLKSDLPLADLSQLDSIYNKLPLRWDTIGPGYTADLIGRRMRKRSNG